MRTPISCQTRYERGDRIGDRFLVHQALRGGMGEVYLCLDLENNLPFALKTFQSNSFSQKLREAFEAEVITWIALEKHPNIVRCHAMEFLDRVPFMVLEWVADSEGQGSDLRTRLLQQSLSMKVALDVVIDVCRGLSYAGDKQRGIVHRDLKPENILIAQDGTAKITDFGLAKIAGDYFPGDHAGDGHAGKRHHTLNIGGTPLYMAPEQWRGDALDSRIDIYAIGCILFELLVGRAAFQASTIGEIRRRHFEMEIPVMQGTDSGRALVNAIIQRCLAKQKTDRYANPLELLDDLSKLYHNQFAEAPKSAPVTSAFEFGDFINRGITYERLGLSTEALADLNRAIEINSSWSFVYVNRGTTLDSLGRHDEALTDYARGIELDPSNKMAFYNRAHTHYTLKDYESALKDYSEAIQLDPTYAIAYQNRGNIYSELERFDEALADYSVAIKLKPDYCLAYKNRSELFSFRELFAYALADLDRAIQLDPSDASIFYRRANLYAKLSRTEEALADYGEALRIDPTNAKVYVNRGNTYQLLDNWQAAIADYARAIELNPQDDKAYYNRGNSLRVEGRYEEALADYTRALEINPQHTSAYLDRGLVHIMLDQHDAALSDFSTAIEKNPYYPKPYLFSGKLLADRGSNREALRFFERASELGDQESSQFAMELRQKFGL